MSEKEIWEILENEIGRGDKFDRIKFQVERLLDMTYARGVENGAKNMKARIIRVVKETSHD